MACTASLASLILLQKKKCRKKIEQIALQQKQFLEKLNLFKEKDVIKNLRQLGTIFAFEVNTKESDGYLHNITNDFTQFCLERGVYLRSLGNTIYVMPPYCIKKNELEKIYKTITEFLNKTI